MLVPGTHMKNTQDDNAPLRLDGMLPVEIANQAEEIGVRKANLDTVSLFLLSLLAGGFIAIGAIFATTVSLGTGSLSYGIARVLAGTAFATGLIMVVVGGAELFTGNNLIVMAYASKRISLAALLRNWAIVYVGNFVGSLITAYAMFLANQHMLANGTMGASMLQIAHSKASLSMVSALVLGVYCNALVCMAVWMCFGTRTTSGRILAIVPPIAAFVAASFEHSVANMYFLPVALFVKQGASPEFFELIQKSPSDFPLLTWGRFIWNNLIPVTIGNIIGGGGLVGAMYWVIYLRRNRRG